MDDNITTVPDDAIKPDILKSSVPDAVVVLEDTPKDKVIEEKPVKEQQGTKNEPRETSAAVDDDAASEGVAAMAKNLEDTKKKLAKTDADKRVAETRVTELETRVVKAENKLTEEQQRNIEANRTAATEAKNAGLSDYDKFKKQAAQLQADGKFEEAEEARANAYEARQKAKGAEDYLNRLDAAVERLKAEPTEEQRPQSDATGRVDPVTGIKFTNTTADWVDKHRDLWKDQDFRVVCDAASRVAKRKGIAVDTPAYFEYIEKRLQEEGYLEAPETTEDDTTVEDTATETSGQPQNKPPAKPAAAAASSGAPRRGASAAPTRHVAGSQGGGRKGVKLTGIEREIAASVLGSLPDVFKGENPDQVWAKNKAAIEAEEG